MMKFLLMNLLMLVYLNLNINLIMMMIYMIIMMFIYLLLSFNYSNDWQLIYSFIGLDNLSFLMIMLSLWIILMMYMVSMKMKQLSIYLLMLNLLLLALLMSFMSMNYFIFYLFFEISLIPTFYLIMGWGYQPERLIAGMFMLMYTMFASLPLLLIMYYLYNGLDSMNYLMMLNNMKLDFSYKVFMYVYMLLAFLVKLPMYLFHMWLPKAHVEAPVTGSMILAGVMLKLGGYGIFRSMLMMLMLSVKLNYLFYSISLIGMIYLSIECLRQNDLKLLVAYSSVVHMGIMLMGMLTLSEIGMIGGFMMMLGHGLCSSALFFLVNLNYERVKSRNMYIGKGLMSIMPSMSLWWFLLSVCNMSSPPSLNLVSELMLVMVIMNWSMNIMLMLIFGMYLSACYSLYLFSFNQHGKFNNLLMKMKNNNISEYIVLMLHWIPLNLLILNMNFFI
nr:NADH dehydrogenase subunit 4 [Merostenus sp.]